jgi:pimeloyl-ACP methyl ester carboxylesterase
MDIFGTPSIVERDGCPIHYWITGPESAPLIVFTHGAQIDHTMYAAQVAALSQQYRIVTWDLRGHGLSQPLRGDLSYRTLANDVWALVDQAGYQQAILVGHSMGGNVAQEAAFLEPERVRALVLIGSLCITQESIKAARIYGRLMLGLARILPEKHLQRFMEGAAKSYSIVPEVQDYIRQQAPHISKAAFAGIARSALTGYHDEPDYHIAAPFLLTHGDKDVSMIVKQAPIWAAREPNCRYVVIPQAGHNANQDNEPFFTKTLCEFLQEHII